MIKTKYIQKSFLLLMTLLITRALMAQHDHQSSQGRMNDQDTLQKHQTMEGKMSMQNMNMSHAFSLNLPMSRNGSGTGWLADASPIYGVMFHTQNWMYMLHGNLFLRYNNQDFTGKGLRGDQKFDAPS